MQICLGGGGLGHQNINLLLSASDIFWWSPLCCRVCCTLLPRRCRHIWQENNEITSIKSAQNSGTLASMLHYVIRIVFFPAGLIRVWVWGCVARNEERSPAYWINGVNNSPVARLWLCIYPLSLCRKINKNSPKQAALHILYIQHAHTYTWNASICLCAT